MGQLQSPASKKLEHNKKNTTVWISRFFYVVGTDEEDSKDEREIIPYLADDALLAPLKTFIQSMKPFEDTMWGYFKNQMGEDQGPLEDIFLLGTDRSLTLDWTKLDTAMKCYLAFMHIENLHLFTKYFDSPSFLAALSTCIAQHKK